jgi:hypothetical protein
MRRPKKPRKMRTRKEKEKPSVFLKAPHLGLKPIK